MNEDRRRTGRRDGSDDSRGVGTADQPPMLVLGEDRPDVEDTTAEELARQRAELEQERIRLEADDRRRRRAAEEKAERLRLEAEKRLAEERRLAEVELAQRQRALDDAERRLYRTERRLRRKAQESGGHVPDVSSRVRGRTSSTGSRKPNSLLAAAERRSGARVPTLPRATVLALVGSGLVVAGGIGSVDPPSGNEVDAFVTADETRVAWLTAGLTLDDEVARYLAGEDVTQDDGTLTSVTQAAEATLTTDVDYPLRDFEEAVAPLLAEPGSSPQRVLSAWDDARASAGYAVSRIEVRDAGEVLDGDRALPTWMLLGGFVLVGGLAYGLARGGTRVGAGLAGLALVPTGMLIADQGRHVEVEPALEAHAQALVDAQEAYEQLGRDLQTVYGTRSVESYERETYWEGPGYLDAGRLDAGATTAYADAREDLADVDIRSLSTEEALPYAEALVEAGGALLAAETASLEDARATVLASTESTLDVGRYATTAAAAALLPLAALAPAALRRREVER